MKYLSVKAKATPSQHQGLPISGNDIHSSRVHTFSLAMLARQHQRVRTQPVVYLAGCSIHKVCRPLGYGKESPRS